MPDGTFAPPDFKPLLTGGTYISKLFHSTKNFAPFLFVLLASDNELQKL
jgi:hypothetical protein